MSLSIYTLSEELTWEHPKKNNFSGIGGIAFQQQNNSYSGRYFIPNYLAVSQGMYYIEKWRKHQWEIQGGIRFDNKIIQTSRLKFNSDTINYNFDFSTLASSFNVAYTASPIWQMNLAVGISSRAPHVNELLSDGIHHGTGTYEKGDISLRPEKSVQVSAGIRYQHPSGKLGMDFLVYANRINDFIYQQPQPNNPVLTISGAFPLIQYQQTNASLRGFDWSAWFKPIENIEWISKYAFLNARNTSINDWLILMPANRLSNEITYRLKNTDKLANSYASIEVMHVSKQNNTPGDLNGKQDYKAAPEAYTLINLQISSTVQLINKPVTLSIGVRNLMNTVYRDYLNSMRYFTDEMGRNISLRIKIQL
jgi:iron complex outermembrane receptor protein